MNLEEFHSQLAGTPLSFQRKLRDYLRYPTEHNACYITGYVAALEDAHLLKPDAASYWLAVIGRMERTHELLTEMDNPPATTKENDMNTEQEHAKFEAWFTKFKAYTGNPKDIFVQVARDIAWDAWQAAQAALQSQYREDAERLDWLQQHDERFYNLLRITSIVNKGFSPTNNSGKRWYSSIREAIDHARRVEGKTE